MTLDKFGQHIHVSEKIKKQLDAVNANSKQYIDDSLSHINGLISVYIIGMLDNKTATHYTFQNSKQNYEISIPQGKVIKCSFMPKDLVILVDGYSYNSKTITEEFFKKFTENSIIRIPKFKDYKEVKVELFVKYPLIRDNHDYKSKTAIN